MRKRMASILAAGLVGAAAMYMADSSWLTAQQRPADPRFAALAIAAEAGALVPRA